MGEVRQTFTANISDLESKLNKLQGEYLKLREAQGTSTKEAREGALGLEKFGADAIKYTTSAIAGFTTFAGVLSITKAAIADYAARLNDAAAAQTKFSHDMNQQLARLGKLREGEEVKDWVAENVRAKTTPATRDQLGAAWSAVARTAPQASEAYRRQLALGAARMAPAMGTEGMTTYAERLGRLSEMLPGKTPQQVMDVETTLRQRLGERGEQLGGEGFMQAMAPLIQSGALTGEQALAIGATALEKRIPLGMMQRLAAKVSEPKQRVAIHSPIDAVKARFYALPAGSPERWQALLGDERTQAAVAGERLAGRIRRLEPGAIEEWKETIGTSAGAQIAELESATAQKAAVPAAMEQMRDIQNLDMTAKAMLYKREAEIQESYAKGGERSWAAQAPASMNRWIRQSIWGMFHGEEDAKAALERLNENILSAQATTAAQNARANGRE